MGGLYNLFFEETSLTVKRNANISDFQLREEKGAGRRGNLVDLGVRR